MNVTRLAAAIGGLLAHALLPIGVAAVAALMLFGPVRCGPAPAHADGAESVDVAIVFLVDTSYSMDSVELAVARRSHVEAFRSPEIVSAIEDGGMRVAVAYVEFGAWAVTLVDWTIVDGPASAGAFAEHLEALPVGNLPRTAISAGLIHAGRLFDDAEFRAERLVVDIVGDGMNSVNPSVLPVAPARNALLDRGAVINGMPLMLAPSEAGLDRYFETVVIGGPGAFSMPLTDIGQMPAALRQKIIAELF